LDTSWGGAGDFVLRGWIAVKWCVASSGAVVSSGGAVASPSFVERCGAVALPNEATSFPHALLYSHHLSRREMRYAGCCINHSTQIMTSHVVGFNPYILRDATGRR